MNEAWVGPTIQELNQIARRVVENAPQVANDSSLLAKYYLDVVGRTCSPQQVVDYLGSTRVMEAGRGFVNHVGPALRALQSTALEVPRTALRHFDKFAASGGAAVTTAQAGGAGLATSAATLATVLGWTLIGAAVIGAAYMLYFHDKPESEPVQAGHRTAADRYEVSQGAQEAPSFTVVTITGTRGFDVISVRPTWKLDDGSLRWNQIRSGGTRNEPIPPGNIRRVSTFATRAEASQHVGALIEKGDNKIFGWATSGATVAIIGGRRYVLDDASALDMTIVRRAQAGRSSLDADEREWNR